MKEHQRLHDAWQEYRGIGKPADQHVRVDESEARPFAKTPPRRPGDLRFDTVLDASLRDVSLLRDDRDEIHVRSLFPERQQHVAESDDAAAAEFTDV